MVTSIDLWLRCNDRLGLKATGAASIIWEVKGTERISDRTA